MITPAAAHHMEERGLIAVADHVGDHPFLYAAVAILCCAGVLIRWRMSR